MMRFISLASNLGHVSQGTAALGTPALQRIPHTECRIPRLIKLKCAAYKISKSLPEAENVLVDFFYQQGWSSCTKVVVVVVVLFFWGDS